MTLDNIQNSTFYHQQEYTGAATRRMSPKWSQCKQSDSNCLTMRCKKTSELSGSYHQSGWSSATIDPQIVPRRFSCPSENLRTGWTLRHSWLSFLQILVPWLLISVVLLSQPSGYRCQTDIDECASDPCQNNATCYDDINGYSCNCTANYTGLNCEVEVSDQIFIICSKENVSMLKLAQTLMFFSLAVLGNLSLNGNDASWKKLGLYRDQNPLQFFRVQ